MTDAELHPQTPTPEQVLHPRRPESGHGTPGTPGSMNDIRLRDAGNLALQRAVKTATLGQRGDASEREAARIAGSLTAPGGSAHALRIRSRISPRIQRGDCEDEHLPAECRADEIVDRLVGPTSAADSRYILELFRSMGPSEQQAVIRELRGRAREMNESAEGPLYRLFEDLTEEDKISLALQLMANGALPQGDVARLLVGRTWAGRWMPVTTEAGHEACDFYARQWIQGEHSGGFGGFMRQVGAGLGGFFSCLWTPETASDTVIALSLARFASIFPRAIGAPMAVLGSATTGLSIGQLITGVSLTGEPLTQEDRVRHWILAVTGIVAIGAGGIHYRFSGSTGRYGGSSGSGGSGGGGRGGGRGGGTRTLSEQEVANFYRTHSRVGRYTMENGMEAEVWAPNGAQTTAMQLPANLPRPLPPPPRPAMLLPPPRLTFTPAPTPAPTTAPRVPAPTMAPAATPSPRLPARPATPASPAPVPAAGQSAQPPARVLAELGQVEINGARLTAAEIQQAARVAVRIEALVSEAAGGLVNARGVYIPAHVNDSISAPHVGTLIGRPFASSGAAYPVLGNNLVVVSQDAVNGVVMRGQSQSLRVILRHEIGEILELNPGTARWHPSGGFQHWQSSARGALLPNTTGAERVTLLRDARALGMPESVGRPLARGLGIEAQVYPPRGSGGRGGGTPQGAAP